MTSKSITIRLCIMMFLEYAIRGIWYPFLANYLTAPKSVHGLGFSPGQSGWILGFANAVGALTAPFIAGQLADRFLNTEKTLAAFHFAAALLLFMNATSTGFFAFFSIMICFSIAYVPTQSLANSLALSHLSNPAHAYPRVRMWGTLGWIVTSALFTFVVLRSDNRATNIARIPIAMRTAAVMAIAYAGYAFILLPATPPRYTTPRSLLSMNALANLFRESSVVALTLVAIPIAAIHTAYYLNIGPFLSEVVGVPLRWVGPTLAISQLSEVLFLFILGPLLLRFGYKIVLTAGALSQMLRFTIFALNPPVTIVILSLALHGIAFACFFTTAVLYIDEVSPPEIRNSTQTGFGIVLFGLGPALAGPYSQLFDRFVSTSGDVAPGFRKIWLLQAAIAAISTLGIMVLFRLRTGSRNSGSVRGGIVATAEQSPAPLE
jgi:nucleoside transporter